MRTKKEIEAEIKALEACKSYIPKRTSFGDDNIAELNIQIEYLKGEIDTSAKEFEDLSDGEQDAVMEAEQWKEGNSEESPSSGWDSYKPK